MSRTEENQKAVAAINKILASHPGSANLEVSGAIALADISESLAIIADALTCKYRPERTFVIDENGIRSIPTQENTKEEQWKKK